MSEDADDLSLDGVIAPPTANGEVVFEAPWQGRVFGMARSLCEAGLYDWDDFRERLIAEVGTAEEDAPYRYFDHFLAALVSLLKAQGLLAGDELSYVETELRDRPHGHDHHHHHD